MLVIGIIIAILLCSLSKLTVHLIDKEIQKDLVKIRKLINEK